MTREERASNLQVWKLRISGFNESGLTQEKWCEENGIKLSALRYWIKKLRYDEMTNNTPEWLRVNVTADNSISMLETPSEIQTSHQHLGCISIRCEGLTLDVPMDVSPMQLANIVRVMRQS